MQLQGSAGGRIETEAVLDLREQRHPDAVPSMTARTFRNDRNHRGLRAHGSSRNIDVALRHISLRRTDIDPFDMSTTPSTGTVHEILCQIPTLTAPYRAVSLEYRSPIKSGEPLTILLRANDDVVRMHFVVGDASVVRC